ncbi:hypothetical protein [Mesorhizobium sp.]|uniref:hypothetical protein n=1 Tax=Mesorhizobium sp. TaxID=1871066 RepID=UPI0011FC8113|nr:hypothetical protein [Mesorhizobium sp.]TIS45691.1 MAG: hypothetical protein E5W96_30230 [Mesorhizobium sp.]
MKNVLLRTIVVPLATRLGTALGAYLMAKGLDGGLADQLVNGLLAVVLVGCDLVAGKVAGLLPKEAA